MAGASMQAIDGRNIVPLIINQAASGALVAAVAGQIIRIYRLLLVPASAVTVQFQDGATNLTGAMSLTANQMLALYMDGNPWFTTSPGNAFNVTLGTGVQISGTLSYTVTAGNPPI